jgi:hypothetical protein
MVMRVYCGTNEILKCPAPPLAIASASAEEWRAQLPAFADETDAALRREMRWNAAVLEQMATWRGTTTKPSCRHRADVVVRTCQNGIRRTFGRCKNERQ